MIEIIQKRYSAHENKVITFQVDSLKYSIEIPNDIPLECVNNFIENQVAELLWEEYLTKVKNVTNFIVDNFKK